MILDLGREHQLTWFIVDLLSRFTLLHYDL